jgi:hypothetical protein
MAASYDDRDLKRLGVAALELLTSLSERNLRHGTTYPMIPRGRVDALAAVVDDIWPGAIDAVYRANQAASGRAILDS